MVGIGSGENGIFPEPSCRTVVRAPKGLPAGRRYRGDAARGGWPGPYGDPRRGQPARLGAGIASARMPPAVVTAAVVGAAPVAVTIVAVVTVPPVVIVRILARLGDKRAGY